MCSTALKHEQGNWGNIRQWYERLTKLVQKVTKGKVTILRNKQGKIDRTITNNKPGITIRDNEKGTCVLIDTAI